LNNIFDKISIVIYLKETSYMNGEIYHVNWFLYLGTYAFF
jgi:hypothetical protein